VRPEGFAHLRDQPGVRRQDEAPDEGDNGDREHRGGEEDPPEDRRASGGPVQREREQQGDHRERRDDQQCEQERVDQGLVKHRIGQNQRVVLETRPIARAEQVGAVEADADAEQQRDR
jgi:hypothetical protein